MRKRNYTKPTMTIVSTETEQAFMAASFNGTCNDNTKLQWGGNASVCNIEEADAKSHDASLWDDDL
jgi:hypothetical protein